MNDNEIKEAIENIKELKELVANKQKQLQPMVFSKAFVNMLLSASIFLLITTLIIAFGYSRYDSFWQFPLILKGLFVITIIFNFIQISIKKLKALNENTTISISSSINEIFSLDFIIAIILSIFFSIIFASVTNLTWVYLPIMTIIYGLLVISFSDSMNVIEFKYMGFLTIFIGIISMLFLQIPLLLLGFSMYTLIFFCYYLLLKFARSHN